MWPKTILPSAVAGPTAAKALQALRLGLHRSLPFSLDAAQALQAGRLGGEALVEGHDLGPGVDGDDIDEVDRPAVETGAGRAGAFGDPLHLLQVLRGVAAEEQRVDEGAGGLPAVGGSLGTLPLGEALDLRRDLRRQEPAVLHAALIRLALDVQNDPAGLRIAVGGAVALHRAGIGLEVRRRAGGVSPRSGPHHDGRQGAEEGQQEDGQASHKEHPFR